MSDRRIKTGAYVGRTTPESDKAWHRANQRALQRLKDRYPGVYRQLMEEESAKEGIRTLASR